MHTPLCSSQILFAFESERLNRIQEYERQLAVQRLQEDDERTTALADFKDRMLEERKAFKRQVLNATFKFWKWKDKALTV